MIFTKLGVLKLLPVLLFIGCVPGQAELDQQGGAGDAKLLTQSKATEPETGEFGTSEPLTNEVSKELKPDPETAKIIRTIAAKAAGMTDDEFKTYVNVGSTPNPARLTNQPLTSFIASIRVMDLPEGAYEDRRAEFRFSSLTPDPNKIVKLIKPTESVDCWTALHPQYITNVSCDSDGKTAKGVISFDAGVYAGKVHYKASKVNNSWQINEFSLPVRDWRFVLNEDGSWHWFDHFGRLEIDRELPTQDIVGEVLLDDELLAVGSVIFWMKDYPELFFKSKLRPGRTATMFKVSVPAGKYVVTFDGKQIPDKKYSRRSTSDLVTEIEEGQTELTLKISSTPE